MNKLLTSVFAFTILLTITLKAQTTYLLGTPMRVYQTYEDVLNNKPVEGVEVTADSKLIKGKRTLMIKKDGAEQSITAKDMTYYAYTNPTGIFLRHQDANFYYILVLGKFCYYYDKADGTLTYGDEGISGYLNPQCNFVQYTSDGPTGEIYYYKKVVKNLFKEAGIYEAYKAEAPQLGFKGYTFEKDLAATIKYLNLYNEKIK